MTYQDTVDYLFSQLPMFQRVGAAAYKADLSNTLLLCKMLGNPESKFKCIHVAGTNGKGSISSTLASIFMESGYKTGLFTSPHLKDYRERIRIDGVKIPEVAVVQFVKTFRPQVEAIKPSFFELTCAMAFDYFAKEQVDIAILETGMGGRLDSTNVVLPELSIITSVSMDHQQFLGNTLEAIAMEKAGIVKAGISVVLSENPPEVVATVRKLADGKGAPLHIITGDDKGLESDLRGSYQEENMRTVAKSVAILRTAGWNLPDKAVKNGALKVSENTGLRGRWEVLSKNPLTIADVAHNEEGVAEVVRMLENLTLPEPTVLLNRQAGVKARKHIVWGMVNDKDATAILRLLPKDAVYYWCKPDVPRGRQASELQIDAKSHGLSGSIFGSVRTAFEEAKKNAKPDEIVFVGGSVFVVAEVLD